MSLRFINVYKKVLRKYILNIIILATLFVISKNASAQFMKIADRVIVAGYVFEETSGNPLPYVNVYIKKSRYGTISDTSGYFMLSALVNDTIVFSSLGYDKKYVILTDSASENNKPLIVFLDTKFYEIRSVEVIALRKYQQLEYEFTKMRLPDDDYIFAANNFPFRPAYLDYYERVNAPGLGLVFSPISALYDMFSKEGKEKQKLAELQSRDYLSSIIDKKVSTELIMKITGLSAEETIVFLNWCNFSPEFILKLTDYDFISVIAYKNRQYQGILQKK